MSSPRLSASISRRRFLETAALAAGTIAFPAIVRSQAASKLNLVIIGCGGRGGGNLQSVKHENIVALCDVNQNAIDAALKHAPGARTFRDFRKLYDTLKDSEYDAVVVSTTEHTHAFATLPALQRKKHVYCEKPLTRDVYEARLITEAAKKAGVVTQMGTQIHSTPNFHRTVELVQSGAIGPIREVHVWVGRSWGWQSPEEAKANGDIVSVQDRPSGSSPIPPELDWDLWLGPAPARPYHEVYFPGPKWYRWWDFGNGTMSDLGSHWIDLPFTALNLDAPLTIEASGPEPHPELAPASMTATYHYAARGDRPAVKLTWYQGKYKPALVTEGKVPQWGNGVLFIGDDGMILADYGKHLLLPEEKFKDFKRPAPSGQPAAGHHQEWLNACRTGVKPSCHFEYAGLLTEANHLGNVAFRAGKKLEWDAKNMRFPNAPEAERFLKREYRSGWSLT